MIADTPNTAARREAAGYIARRNDECSLGHCRDCQHAGSIKRVGAPTLWHCSQHRFATRANARCNTFEAKS